jgi:hypothetical protein
MSDLGDIFEKRVDAYMRHHNLLRLSDARALYNHAGVEGEGYPKLPLFSRMLRRGKKVLGFQKANPKASEQAQSGAGLGGDYSMKGSS